MDLLEREAEVALVVRLQARDESALAELYERLGAKVFTLAINMLNSQEEAEEVLQDTFLKLYRGASGFSAEGGSARAFLYTIARNECLSRLRAKRSRPNKADDYDLHDPNATFSNFSTQPSDTVINVMLEQALDQLEETDQALVKGAFFDGYSHAELASNSGLPLGTVKSRVRRALLTLRSFLEKP